LIEDRLPLRLAPFRLKRHAVVFGLGINAWQIGQLVTERWVFLQDAKNQSFIGQVVFDAKMLSPKYG